jgi:glycosyltransferase involved in cell wall biosynthesis
MKKCMKFSVLLPTRNRLTFLRFAVESVRRQPETNWEIIVSDNASEEDIAGYVRGLGDARIKYFRTPRSLPVTDNWNNALEQSQGDYVIMLGDDDCLLPGYFHIIQRLVEQHQQPDLIYSAGYLYAYPQVMPGHPNGYLHRTGCAGFFGEKTKPFFLDRETARRMVDCSMSFQARFEYNMQYSTISRRMINALQSYGPFFQSPFPDFFASNALLLKAERILVCPQPLVVIGISPKSYGFYHYNQQESGGVAFLQCFPDKASAERLEKIVLPGSNMNTSWLFAMETLKAKYGAEFGLNINYNRYRQLQLLNYCQERYIKHSLRPSDIAEMGKLLRWPERIVCHGVLPVCRLLGKKVLKEILRWPRRWLAQHAKYDRPKDSRKFGDILEVFTYFAARDQSASMQEPEP